MGEIQHYEKEKGTEGSKNVKKKNKANGLGKILKGKRKKKASEGKVGKAC